MSENKIGLATIIRSLRGEQSQEAFATLIGCTKQYVSMLESGRQTPSWKMLETLAEKTGKQLIVKIE